MFTFYLTGKIIKKLWVTGVGDYGDDGGSLYQASLQNESCSNRTLVVVTVVVSIKDST